MDGLDLHLLVLKEAEQKSGADQNEIKGLVIFNQESLSSKLPNGRYAVKIILHHISVVNIADRETILDMALDYIWKYMHCSAIRLNLYHFAAQGTDQLKADPDMKKLLKAKKFKWKTVINDTVSNIRYEILEC